MFGNTLDEGSLFVLLGFPIFLQKSQIEDLIEASFGPEFREKLYNYYDQFNLSTRVRKSMGTADMLRSRQVAC